MSWLFAFVSTPAACSGREVQVRRAAAAVARRRHRRVLLVAARRLAAPGDQRGCECSCREATCRCPPRGETTALLQVLPFADRRAQGRGNEGLRRCRGGQDRGHPRSGSAIAFQAEGARFHSEGRSPGKDVASTNAQSQRGRDRLPNDLASMSNAPTTIPFHKNPSSRVSLPGMLTDTSPKEHPLWRIAIRRRESTVAAMNGGVNEVRGGVGFVRGFFGWLSRTFGIAGRTGT